MGTHRPRYQELVLVSGVAARLGEPGHRGLVFDAANLERNAGKLVQFACPTTWVRADREGRFQTKALERAIEYRAAVSTRTKYNSRGELVSGKSDWFEATDRTTPFGDIAVERLRSLRGKTVDEDAKPVEFARVTRADAGPGSFVAHSKADGRFTFYGVFAPGEYRLQVGAYRHETRKATIRVGKEHFRSRDDLPTIVLRRQEAGSAGAAD